MAKSVKRRQLADAYTFPGFRPLQRVQGMFGDPSARLITLVRRGKKRSAAPAVRRIAAGTTDGNDGYGICPAPIIVSTSTWRCVESIAGSVAR
jgi:hypothetical protein